MTHLTGLLSSRRSIDSSIELIEGCAVPGLSPQLHDGELGGEIAVSEEQAIMVSRYLAILLLPCLNITSLETAEAAGESPKDVLAAQIRSQGVVCNKALRATRDAKRSKPDHEVWVLQCDNATYRIGRYPDLAAKIERLR